MIKETHFFQTHPEPPFTSLALDQSHHCFVDMRIYQRQKSVINLGSPCNLLNLVTCGIHFDRTAQVLIAPGKYLPAYFLPSLRKTLQMKNHCMIQIHHQETEV